MLKLKQFTKFGNAGDVASSIIVSHILQTQVQIIGEGPSDSPNLIGIGSILHWSDANSVVWGAGYINQTICFPNSPRSILAVRGELTLERLRNSGHQVSPLLGDPGALISQLYTFTGKIRKGVGVVPHYVDMDDAFVNLCREAGFRIINPLSDIETYLSELTDCEIILTSSLHGLVFAHSYGIPAAWVEISNKVIGDGFKFKDYYSSIGYDPRNVVPLNKNMEFPRIIDHANLPIQEIDRGALKETLRSWYEKERSKT